MTCKRILRLKIQPVRTTEILEALSQFEPVYKEEEAAFILWYSKTPLGKSRQKVFDTIENEQLGNDSKSRAKSNEKQN